MKETIILDPLEEKEESSKSFNEIKTLMNTFYKKQNTVMTFEEILIKLNTTEKEYILAIRST